VWLSFVVVASGCSSEFKRSPDFKKVDPALLQQQQAEDGKIIKPEGACDLPWGGFIADGEEIEAFDAATLSCKDDQGQKQFCSANGSTHRQLRKCSKGVLSGDAAYRYGSCYEQGCSDCNLALPEGALTLKNGDSLKLFSTGSVGCGASCISKTFSCMDGEMKDQTGTAWSAAAFPATSCSAQPCSCTAPDPVTGKTVTYPHGATQDFWDQLSLVCGDSCDAHRVKLNCKDGSWGSAASAAGTTAGLTNATSSSASFPNGAIRALDGKNYFNRCSVTPCKTCGLPWNTATQVPDYRNASKPQPIRVFADAAPQCPATCSSTELKCTDGVWTKLDGKSYSGGLNQSCSCQCRVSIRNNQVVPIPTTEGMNLANFWTAANTACGSSSDSLKITATCSATAGLRLTGAATTTTGSSNWYSFGGGTPPPPASGCTCPSLDPADRRTTSSNGRAVSVASGVSTYNYGDQQVFYTKSSIQCGRGDSCSNTANQKVFSCINGRWEGAELTRPWYASCQDQPCQSCSGQGLIAELRDYEDASKPAPVTMYKASTPACPAGCESGKLRCNNGSLEVQNASGSWLANNGLYSSSSCGDCTCRIATKDWGSVSFLGTRTFYDTNQIACGDRSDHQVTSTCSPTSGPSPTPPSSGWYAGTPQPPKCVCTLPDGKTVPAGKATLFKSVAPTCQNNCDTLQQEAVCREDPSDGKYKLFIADEQGNATSALLNLQTYSSLSCQRVTPCTCTTPAGGPQIPVGGVLSVSTAETLPCGVPCSSVQTVAECGFNSQGSPILLDQKNNSPLDAKYAFLGCRNIDCAIADIVDPSKSNNQTTQSGGDGGGAGGGQGTGNGRGRGDEDLEITVGGGGGPGGGLQGCDVMAVNDPRYQNLPISVGVTTMRRHPSSPFSQGQFDFSNRPPEGAGNFSMGGVFSSGLPVRGFAKEVVAGSESCESVRTTSYVDLQGTQYRSVEPATGSGTPIQFPSCRRGDP
jgi:hypothetical protein